VGITRGVAGLLRAIDPLHRAQVAGTHEQQQG